ncbi:MAG TPA: class I SAM-dependent methyltransferase [Acidisphaera sp.]|nr:class I SAM-dependent methyltransferase [Acidisphaera sp.]
MERDTFSRLLSGRPSMDADDVVRMREICARVDGYSDHRHYAFFKHLFGQTDIRSVLILGVFCGRDIVFMLDTAARAGREISVTGVDKFSDDSCADWPEALKGGSWLDAGFGLAPSLTLARHNIDAFGFGDRVRLIKERDEVFLPACQDRFDFIYIDTSHDYATMHRQIRQVLRLLAPGGVLGGDDYRDGGTWGVKRAVSESLPNHAVFDGWIWAAPAQSAQQAATALHSR